MVSTRKASAISFFGLISRVLLFPEIADSFPITSLPAQWTLQRREGANLLHMSASAGEDDVDRQLKKAKELIAKTKAKLEALEAQGVGDILNENEEKVPFFASKRVTSGDAKKKQVLKSKNKQGLSTFDGEKMAKMSEQEVWEIRSLLEVFENEIEESDSDPFADRDVAASIYNLRKSLDTMDFQRIFDKRNRWIGEP